MGHTVGLSMGLHIMYVSNVHTHMMYGTNAVLLCRALLRGNGNGRQNCHSETEPVTHKKNFMKDRKNGSLRATREVERPGGWGRAAHPEWR